MEKDSNPFLTMPPCTAPAKNAAIFPMPPATALQNSDHLSTPREPVCSSYCSRFNYQALTNQMAVTGHNLLPLSR